MIALSEFDFELMQDKLALCGTVGIQFRHQVEKRVRNFFKPDIIYIRENEESATFYTLKDDSIMCMQITVYIKAFNCGLHTLAGLE